MSASRPVFNDDFDHQTAYQTFGEQEPLESSFLRNASIQGISPCVGTSLRNSIRDSLLSYGGRRVSIRDLGGRSSLFCCSTNLVKNLVGAGVLALPSGVYEME